MNRKIKAIGIAVCVLLVTAGAVLPVERTLNVDRDIITKQMTIGKTDSLARLGEISRYFTKNCGQINAEAVKYYIQDGGVWLLENSVAFYIREPHEVSNAQGYPEPKSEFGGETGEAVCDGVVLKVNYEGANHVDPKGQGILPHRSNFFYGENSIEWRSGVPNYQEVVYPNIYDNIDLIFQDSQRGLKYSFVVHPGGNPSDIRMRYEGIEKLDIDSSGNLTIRTSIGVLTDSELFIYQHTDQDENEVEGRFTIIDSTTYGFEISECYDKDKDLLIDPLIYSTLLGGEDSEESYGIAVDYFGKVYVTGYTESVDFPTTAGAYDETYNDPYRNVFVFKLNPDSTIPPNQQLIYSTYIGDKWKDSVGWGITIGSGGNAYVTGEWAGSIFVLKLNPNGNLVYKRHYGTGCGRDIFTNYGPIHNHAYVKSKVIYEYIYVTGYTTGNLSTTQGAYQPNKSGSADAFVLKVDPVNGDTLYGSYFGGSGFDRGFSIAVDPDGKAYVTGETHSSNFPVEPEWDAYQVDDTGYIDAFVFILQPDGDGANDLFYSSYLGGNMDDWGNGIALRPWGSTVEVYITGFTESDDFPTTSNAYDETYNASLTPNMQGDVFVVKLVPSPDTPGDDDLKYSTYIGGWGRDEGLDIVVDSAGDAYVTGYAMVDFPVTQNAFDGSYNGDSDVFVLKLRTGTPPPFSFFSPKLKYSTYIGGESGEVGRAISLGPGGVYITGGTWKKSVFPTTSGAYQTTQMGKYDVFVVKTECPTNFYQLIEFVPI